MPIHQLTQVGRTSGGVVFPKSELRALGLVDEEGNMKDQLVWLTQTDNETWEVSLINTDYFPQA